MGLFSFTQEIAMDLGTANTIITTNGKIVVDEPSVVALDRRTDKMIAVGDKAKMMHEKTHENIRTIRPLRDGVIADFYACEQMICFGVHHELAEVGQRKRPSVVRKGIEHDEQQRYYDKYKQKQRVGYRPVAPAHEEMG